MKEQRDTISLFYDVTLLVKGRMRGVLPFSATQCQALGFIGRMNTPTMHELAHYFNITAPSATSLVDELVKAKLIVRTSNTKDRRKVQLTLSPKGKAAYKKLAQKYTDILNDVFKVLSQSDRDTLNAILTKILASN
jgi:DNA-binding MarR family transcriptional regulator